MKIRIGAYKTEANTPSDIRRASDAIMELAKIKAIAEAAKKAALSQAEVQILEGQLNKVLIGIYSQAFDLITSTILGQVKSPQDLIKLGTLPDRDKTSTRGYRKYNRRGKRPILVASKTRPGMDLSKLNTQIELHWKPLAPSTLKQKDKDKVEDPRSYFIHTGALKTALTKLQSPMVLKGRLRGQLVKVETIKRYKGQPQARDIFGKFTSPNKSVPIQAIKIKILPNLNLNLLRDDGKLEERLLGKNNMKKLMNRTDNHRALVQPVISYYTRFQAPDVMRQVLQRFLS